MKKIRQKLAIAVLVVAFFTSFAFGSAKNNSPKKAAYGAKEPFSLWEDGESYEEDGSYEEEWEQEYSTSDRDDGLNTQIPTYGTQGSPPKEHAGLSDNRVIKGNWENMPIVDNTYKVHDFTGVLTTAQLEQLEQRARAIGEANDIDVIIVVTANALGRNEKDFIWDFYEANAFGTNEGTDGVMFLQDFDNNQINVSTHGRVRYTEEYERDTKAKSKDEFTHKDTDKILDGVIDEVLSKDRYNTYGAANYFLDEVEAHFGKPQRVMKQGMAVGLGGSALMAFLSLLGMQGAHNKTLSGGVHGTYYIPKDGLKFRERDDKFVRTHTSRRARASSSSGGGRGGGSSSGSSSSGSSFGGGSRSF